jgi:site-specific DNA-cytosine methylase
MGSEVKGCYGNVSHTKIKGSQGYGLSTHMETEYGQNFTKGSFKKQHTWWETQSRICGVPHGISFELDKTRKHRIKSLGNSIVPQIVRQLGLAIMEAENDNN